MAMISFVSLNILRLFSIIVQDFITKESGHLLFNAVCYENSTTDVPANLHLQVLETPMLPCGMKFTIEMVNRISQLRQRSTLRTLLFFIKLTNHDAATVICKIEEINK